MPQDEISVNLYRGRQAGLSILANKTIAIYHIVFYESYILQWWQLIFRSYRRLALPH